MIEQVSLESQEDARLFHEASAQARRTTFTVHDMLEITLPHVEEAVRAEVEPVIAITRDRMVDHINTNKEEVYRAMWRKLQPTLSLVEIAHRWMESEVDGESKV